MKKSLVTAFVLLFIALSGHSAIINGILVDANDTTELIGATVALLRADADSTQVGGTVSDETGVFNLEGVRPGKYRLRISYIGYNDVIKHVTVGNDGRNVNMGAIKMTPNTVVLRETVVTGVKTPITVKEDTVEYNADSYKVQTNAVVEDLLKRLPGVEVGSDGKITANGKEVTKILVDGKEFFNDDPTVASRNLPADMVNKLQVVDRKSELARLTGVDDGEDETVINLTTKKGMNNGWFGNVEGGYGTDDRYKGSFMANHFRNGNQISLLGGANNVNELGFTDGGRGRFNRFGGDNGITTSQYAGINFNVGSTEDEHLRIGGDVMYSHTDRDTRTSTAREYLFADSTSYYDALSASRDKGHNVRGDFRIKWEIDSANSLNVIPQFSLNFSESARNDSSMTRAGDAAFPPVNRSVSRYTNDGKSYESGARIIYRHQFLSRPGRSLSLMANYRYSNLHEDADTWTNNTYFLQSDQDEVIDQTQNDRTKTHSVSGRITWTEPLGDPKKTRYLELAYQGNYRHSANEKMVWDNDRNTDGSVADRSWAEDLSEDFLNVFFDQSLRLGFRQTRKAYNLNVGLSVNSAMSKSTDRINSDRNIAERWAWTVAPFARLNYKFSKVSSLRLDYRMRAQQPSMKQLQPVADESNPLNIVVGNPALKPTFAHHFNVRFQDFNQQRQRSVMAMLNVDFEQNSIISTTSYDAITGGRLTSYTNVNGVWNAMAMNMFSLPFGASKTWYFSNALFLRYQVTKGVNNDVENRSNTLRLNLSPGLAFRNGEFDLEVRPRYSFQNTRNTVQTGSNRNIHTWGGRFNGTYNAPFGLVLSTDLSYSNSTGYSEGYDSDEWLWNASLSYSFLRNKQMSVIVSVYDILGDKKDISRSVTANYIDDQRFNSLTRYGMITLNYKFSTFKKGEEPRGEFDDRGPGGFGRPGGRPGPPPRGGQRPF